MAPLRERREDPVLPDPPQGPLHAARARASFPWKELALFWEGEEMLRFKVRLGWGPLGASVARGGSAGLLVHQQKDGGVLGELLGAWNEWTQTNWAS